MRGKSTPGSTGIIEEYFELQKKYEILYGERTVLLMQKGVFYECYEFDKICDESITNENESCGHARDIAMVLNMLLTSSDKGKPHSRENPFMMGFPIIKFDQHSNVLLEHGYTIVKYDEDSKWKKVKGESVPRNVTEIISPGTNIHTEDTNSNTTIVSIYIENVSKKVTIPEQTQIICGVSWIDVCTGKNMIAEIYSKEYDSVYAIQELYRYCVSHQPKELILHLNHFPNEKVDGGKSFADSYLKYLDTALELEKYGNLVIKVNDVKDDYTKVEYQQQFLNKVFQFDTNQNDKPVVNRRLNIVKPSCKEKLCERNEQSEFSEVKPKILLKQSKNSIEELNLERMHYGRISYLILLQYCYEHNEIIIKKLHKPDTTWIDMDRHLILTHNAVVQLNLIPAPKSQHHYSKINSKLELQHCNQFDSVFSVINFTSTPMGRRFLKTMLLNPLIDPDEIEGFYNLTDELLSQPVVLEKITMLLKKIHDIERYQRKLMLVLMKPKDLAVLMKDYLHLTEIYTTLVQMDPKVFRNILLTDSDVQQFNTCLTKVCTLIDLDSLLEFNEDNGKLISSTSISFIRPGTNLEVDTKVKTIINLNEQMQKICQHLNSFLQKFKGKSKLIEYSSLKNKTDIDFDDEENGSENELTFGTLQTTDAKGRILKQKEDEIDQTLCGKLKFTKEKSKCLISSDKIQTIAFEIEQNKSQLQKLLHTTFINVCKDINTYTFYASLVRFVSILDFVKSNAICSLKYKYQRPKIIRDSPRSFFTITDLRHPIVERSVDQKYITNDISFDTTQGMLLYGLNGVGKCLHPDQLVILYSGRKIAAKDIQIGDLLMGDDLYSRKVLSLSKGNDVMYRIQPKHGKSFICTGDHKLVLKSVEQTVVLTVLEYLSLTTSKYSLYSVPIDFPEVPFEIEPYVVGKFLKDVLLKEVLLNENCIFNPNIPDIYIYTSRRNRLELIRGLFEDDGCIYIKNNKMETEMIIINEQKLLDIEYIVESLGYLLIPENKTNSEFVKYQIGGTRFDELEHVILCDRTFTVENVGYGPYNGFELDGNHHFLLGDFTVTHNSILSKAISINIILAQAGLFCSCSMTLAPYNKLITRLSGHDDLFRAKSSFMIEMEELRTIIRHSDENTFVAGDELCRGTETQSATALTVTTIINLIKRKTSFVLSTHLHDLPNISYINEICVNQKDVLKICHLSTTYDEKTQSLIYDRKLKDGQGETVYGILVARSVGIDKDFIDQANKILLTLRDSPEILSTRKSHFNSKIYLDHCCICKTNINLDTHHLDEQHTADKSGFINHYHKNSKFNLIPLCKICHSDLHKNKMKLIKRDGISETILELTNE